MADGSEFSLLLYRVIGALLLVLAVALVLGHMVKRWRRSAGNVLGAYRIQVVAREPVGLKQQLILVAVQDRLLLLGLAPDGMQLLSDLGEMAQPSTGQTGSPGSEAPSRGPFQALLQKMTASHFSKSSKASDGSEHGAHKV